LPAALLPSSGDDHAARQLALQEQQILAGAAAAGA
jgi:hypothetical protein